MSLERLAEFFADLQHAQGIAGKAQRQVDRYLATQFSLFNFYDPDENGMTRILADLLDPEGSHGQREFFEAFLKQLNHPVLQPGIRVRTMEREHGTQWTARRRRVDLMLHFDQPRDYVLAIENKLWAVDQEDQIRDYVDYLDARWKASWTLIYLSPDGRRPSSLDAERGGKLEAEGRLIYLAYRSIADARSMSIQSWCRHCLELAEAEPVRWFLRDLIGHIQASSKFANQ